MITDIRLHSMTLENFRGFTQVEIPFEQDLTVFIARNGGGKTSVLDAAAEGLRQWVGQFLLEDDLPPTQLSKRDIKINTDKAKGILYLDVAFSFSDTEETEESVIDVVAEETVQFIIQFDLYKDNSEIKAIINPADKLHLIEESIQELSVQPLPVVLYYRAENEEIHYNNGLPSTTNEEESTIPSLRIEGLYKDALQTRRPGFKDFYHWFDQRSKYELYSKKKGYIEKEEEDKQLAPVRVAIEQMLSDEKTTYRNLEIDYRRNVMSIEKKIAQETVNLEVGQLSSGERHLFALVSQLALRLVRANPGSENPLTEGFGIVLLDELDAHLHPTWQRTIVTKLRKVFPKVQFVVTTHSPEIVKGLDNKHIKIIQQHTAIMNAPHTKGRDTNAILEDVFGEPERLPEYEDKLEQFYRLLDSNKDDAKAILEELKKDMGETDTEIIRAESYLEIF